MFGKLKQEPKSNGLNKFVTQLYAELSYQNMNKRLKNIIKFNPTLIIQQKDPKRKNGAIDFQRQ